MRHFAHIFSCSCLLVAAAAHSLCQHTEALGDPHLDRTHARAVCTTPDRRSSRVWRAGAFAARRIHESSRAEDKARAPPSRPHLIGGGRVRCINTTCLRQETTRLAYACTRNHWPAHTASHSRDAIASRDDCPFKQTSLSYPTPHLTADSPVTKEISLARLWI